MNRAAAIDVITAAAGSPFRRGVDDCFALAAAVVEAMTGRRPPWAMYVGCYRTLDQALDLLRATGFDDLGQGLAAHYREIAPGSALLGDLGVPAGEAARYTVYVFDGQTFVTRKDVGGLGRVRLADVARAFRVS